MKSEQRGVAEREEFFRLGKLGWSPWQKASTGVYTAPSQNTEKIYFPENAWDSSLSEGGDYMGWWAQHRARSIRKVLLENKISSMWEIGAGDGNASIPLFQSGIDVFSVEPLESGALSISKAGVPTFHGTLEALNLPTGSIDCIGLFDVLEHIEHPEKLLGEIYRVLSPAGYLILTVPSHQWLFSDFDSQIGHFRRYSAASLTQELAKSSFAVQTLRPLFLPLIFPALILRRIPYFLGRRREVSQVTSATRKQSNLLRRVDGALLWILSLENAIKPPTGLSLLAVAVKSDFTHTK